MTENSAAIPDEYSWALAGTDDDLRAHVLALLANIAGIDTINPAKLTLPEFTAIVVGAASSGRVATVEGIKSEAGLLEVQHMCLMCLKGLARVVVGLYIERKEGK